MPSARALIYSHFAPVFVRTLFIICSRPLRVIFTRLLCSPQYIFFLCALSGNLYVLSSLLANRNLVKSLNTIARYLYSLESRAITSCAHAPVWLCARVCPRYVCARLPLCLCARALARPPVCAFAPCVAVCACLLPVCARLPPVWLCARARYLYVRVCLLLCVCVRLPLCVRVCLLLFVRACLPLCVCDCLPLCVCARTCPCMCMCMWGGLLAPMYVCVFTPFVCGTCSKYFVF